FQRAGQGDRCTLACPRGRLASQGAPRYRCTPAFCLEDLTTYLFASAVRRRNQGRAEQTLLVALGREHPTALSSPKKHPESVWPRWGGGRAWKNRRQSQCNPSQPSWPIVV